MEWNKSVWESSLDYGPRTLRLAVDTHAITSHFALPLLIRIPGGLVVELTDGPDDYNATNYGVSFFYDLAKASVSRMAFALAHELRRPNRATVVSLTPGGLRSEAMLEAYGVTESTWRDATKRALHFSISESPAFVGRAVAALAQDPDVSRWNGTSLSSGQLAKIYGFSDLDGSQPRCLEVRQGSSGRRQACGRDRLRGRPEPQDLVDMGPRRAWPRRPSTRGPIAERDGASGLIWPRRGPEIRPLADGGRFWLASGAGHGIHDQVRRDTRSGPASLRRAGRPIGHAGGPPARRPTPGAPSSSCFLTCPAPSTPLP
jgi:hypothetical protein